MPCYFQKTWWEGDGPANPGNALEDQWPKPRYRPGWRVKLQRLRYAKEGSRVGKIAYVHLSKPGGVVFYMVIRASTGENLIAFEHDIVARLEKKDTA